MKFLKNLNARVFSHCSAARWIIRRAHVVFYLKKTDKIKSDLESFHADRNPLDDSAYWIFFDPRTPGYKSHDVQVQSYIIDIKKSIVIKI